MATLISDLYGADPSPFHHSRAASTHQPPQLQSLPPSQPQPQHLPQPQQAQAQHLQQSHPMLPIHSSQPLSSTASASTSTSASASASASAHAIPPSHPASPPLSSSNSFSSPPHLQAQAPSQSQSQAHFQFQPQTQSHSQSRFASTDKSDGSERIPTPPDSYTPTSPQHQHHLQQHQQHTDQTSPRDAPASSRVAMSSDVSVAGAAALPVLPVQTIPLSVPIPIQALPVQVAVPVQDEPRVQKTIMIRDLAHIQTLTQPDHMHGHSLSGDGIVAGDAPLQDIKFDISAMPIGDIIEMVAALLTKITTTNDHQHDALHRNAANSRQAQAHNAGHETASPSSAHSPHSASVLAFHGKNVPAITILSYLSRIHKYCPTTYEVFLSLLVYFDRMTERVNDLVMKQQRTQSANASAASTASITPAAPRAPAPAPASAPADDVAMGNASDDDGATVVVEEADENIADSSSDSSSSNGSNDDDSQGAATTRSVAPNALSSSRTASPHLSATYFVVDSYNIHRLIIAGVTCASKFFSDVFYTNARYAKVGGLPLAELNHLELQFLILNDFRMAIPMEDLDAYATMLVEFYARDVVGQRPRPSV